MLKKSKYLNICFSCSPGKGSENQLGYIYSLSQGKNSKVTICPEFEFNEIPLKIREFRKIKYKKIKGSIYIKFGKIEKKPFFERIVFQYWIIKFFLFYLFFLKKKRMLHFITYNQVLTLNPFHIIYKEKAIFGPLGGQPILFDFKFISFKKRIINFVIQYLYLICSFNLVKTNKKNFFCHPKLSEKFDSNNFFPIINLGDLNNKISKEKYEKFIKRNNVIFIGKNLEIKLPHIVKSVFSKLSGDYKDFNFIIVGPGFENIILSKNFEIKSFIPRESILELFRRSYLHVFISLELGGFVSAESAYNYCPNFITKNFGADLVFNNDDEFCLKLNKKMTTNIIEKQLYNKVSLLLKNKKKVFEESIRQRKIIETQDLKLMNNYLN